MYCIFFLMLLMDAKLQPKYQDISCIFSFRGSVPFIYLRNCYRELWAVSRVWGTPLICDQCDTCFFSMTFGEFGGLFFWNLVSKGKQSQIRGGFLPCRRRNVRPCCRIHYHCTLRSWKWTEKISRTGGFNVFFNPPHLGETNDWLEHPTMNESM